MKEDFLQADPKARRKKILITIVIFLVGFTAVLVFFSIWSVTEELSRF